MTVLDAHNRGSRTAEWLTPPAVIAQVVGVLGSIDLDPCADPRRSIPARLHFTRADHSLTRPWFGNVFMNPPYGRVLPHWLAKLSFERDSGRVREAITLTPGSTDAAWFVFLWDADALCFVRGRLRFSGGATNAPHASVIGYYGRGSARFAKVFGEIGKVIYPKGGAR